MSVRASCRLFSVPRSTLSYQSVLAAKDAPLLARMAALAASHPRYGYRRIRVLLGREGLHMSESKMHRLWKKASLQVPKKRRRRVPVDKRLRLQPTTRPNQVWAYDFVHDSCANGQVLKCLTVVDEHTRECLAIEVAASIRSEHIINILGRLIAVHGAPAFLRSDNGPEFVATAVHEWLKEENICAVHIPPGQPWKNGKNESFNGKFRDQCLDAEWFPSRREATVVIEEFRKNDNSIRPHSSLGNQTPLEFKSQLNQDSKHRFV